MIKYLITHNSITELRPPKTEIVNGSIEAWLKENPGLYISYCVELKEPTQ
jgi:hypothetical protein